MYFPLLTPTHFLFPLLIPSKYHYIFSLPIPSESHSHFPLSTPSGGNISPREEGRRVKVMVVGKSELATALDAGRASVSASGCLTHIGNVTIEAKTSWEELDAMIANTLKVELDSLLVF